MPDKITSTMKTVLQFPDKERVEQEAAAWIARLDQGNLDDIEKEGLRSWLAQDPSHRQAIERLARIWNDMDCMHILANIFPDESSPAGGAWRRWIPASAVGVASTILLATGLYLGGVIEGLQPRQISDHKMPSELTYVTGLGEQFEARLGDGSLLTLNTGSEVRIQFNNTARSVYLERGEAHFKVAKNPDLPFEVHAGHGIVRAVGTAFNVRLAKNGVNVLVNEGVIEVLTEGRQNSPSQNQPPAPVRAEMGTAVNYDTDVTRTEKLPDTQIEQRLAWRKGKWMFEGETLAEVLEEVGRYSDRKIVITDPPIAELRVGGYFDIGDIDGLFQALEAGFGIQVVKIGDSYQLAAKRKSP